MVKRYLEISFNHLSLQYLSFLLIMQVADIQYVKNPSFPINWKKSSSAYSDDDLINAYLKGVEAGKNENNRVLLTELKNNISHAAQIAEDLLKEAEGKKIKLKEIHLKADNISNYTALFVANMNDFVSDDFRAIYTLARRIQNESEKENFYISFSFMPYSKSLSEHCLISDGFFMKYEKK